MTKMRADEWQGSSKLKYRSILTLTILWIFCLSETRSFNLQTPLTSKFLQIQKKQLHSSFLEKRIPQNFRALGTRKTDDEHIGEIKLGLGTSQLKALALLSNGAKHLCVILVIFASVILGCVSPILAAESGGRFGGSFEPSPSTSTSSSAESERFASLGDGPRPKVVITRQSDYPAYRKDPDYVPASERRAGNGVSKSDLLIYGGGATAFVVSRVAKKKTGTSNAGTGPITTQLQVGLFCDRSQPNNIIDYFGQLGKQVDPSSRTSLGQAVQSGCLELLRNEASWVSAGSKMICYDAGEYQSCERDFSQLTLKERTKWDRDTFANTPSSKIMSNDDAQKVYAGGPTYAVFTIIIAWEFFMGYSEIKDQKTLKDLLNIIASEATSSNSKNVLSVEVLWTPEKRNDVLQREELIGKWPTLIDV